MFVCKLCVWYRKGHFKTSQNLSNPVDVHDMFSEPSPIVSGGLFKEFWEKCLRWKGGGFPPGSSRFDIAMVNNPIFIDEKGYTQIHQCKPDLRPISMFFLPRSNQIDRLEKALPLQVGWDRIQPRVWPLSCHRRAAAVSKPRSLEIPRCLA